MLTKRVWAAAQSRSDRGSQNETCWPARRKWCVSRFSPIHPQPAVPGAGAVHDSALLIPESLTWTGEPPVTLSRAADDPYRLDAGPRPRCRLPHAGGRGGACLCAGPRWHGQIAAWRLAGGVQAARPRHQGRDLRAGAKRHGGGPQQRRLDRVFPKIRQWHPRVASVRAARRAAAAGPRPKIDDRDVGHAPFLRCHSFACYAQVVVEDTLVEQLRTGKTAIFIIFQTEEAGIGIPISLNGFQQALATLK